MKLENIGKAEVLINERSILLKELKEFKQLVASGKFSIVVATPYIRDYINCLDDVLGEERKNNLVNANMSSFEEKIKEIDKKLAGL